MLADAVDPVAFDEQPRPEAAGPELEQSALQVVPLDGGMNLAVLQEPVPREVLRELLHTLAERYGVNWRPEPSGPPGAH